METIYSIIFNAFGLVVLLFSEWWDYSSTVRLYQAGWLNTTINDRGQHVESKESNSFFMKRGVFQESKFKTFKIALVAFCVIGTILILAFADDWQYTIAPFVFNLIVGIYHARLGYKNNKNYSYIAEVLGRK